MLPYLWWIKIHIYTGPSLPCCWCRMCVRPDWLVQRQLWANRRPVRVQTERDWTALWPMCARLVRLRPSRLYPYVYNLIFFSWSFVMWQIGVLLTNLQPSLRVKDTFSSSLFNRFYNRTFTYLACSANLPEGLYILFAIIFLYFIFQYRSESSYLLDRFSRSFHQIKDICVNFLDPVQFFWFLKGSCHGNQFCGDADAAPRSICISAIQLCTAERDLLLVGHTSSLTWEHPSQCRAWTRQSCVVPPLTWLGG